MPQAGQREIDPPAQPAPDHEFDQRIGCRRKAVIASRLRVILAVFSTSFSTISRIDSGGQAPNTPRFAV